MPALMSVISDFELLKSSVWFDDTASSFKSEQHDWYFPALSMCQAWTPAHVADGKKNSTKHKKESKEPKLSKLIHNISHSLSFLDCICLQMC